MRCLSNRSLQSSVRKKILLVSLLVSLVVFAAFQMQELSSVQPQPQYQTAPAPQATSTTYVPSAPVRLSIPAIELDAKVENLGLTKTGGELDVPKNFVDVGWYQDGPKPGAPGSAVMDGHLSGKHVLEGVFFKLRNLSPGDSVFITDESNHRLEFIVTDVKTFV